MIRMEGNKGGRVGVQGVEDDMGDGMQCSDHPYRNNPGGICAVCLQEKLAKLVSSSFPLPIRASSSSSSSPSFRSNIATTSSSTMRPCSSITATLTSAPPSSSSSSSLALSVRPTLVQKNASTESDHEHYTRRTRLPFFLAKKKKKPSASTANSDIILKRSKSTVTPRRNHSLVDADEDTVIEDFGPRRRNGFWSFLYLSSSKSSTSTKKLKSKSFRDTRISTTNIASTSSATASKSKSKSDTVVEEDNSPNSNTTTASASSFERKISRSRSVGCGSRSFSGDFFERISTGFGDCTLRRVESQREGNKPKVAAATASGAAMNRERVRCAGIFSGFMMASSSSSSSSSSSYWVSSSADDTMNGKSASVAFSHGRARSWGWAFASPMRAFSSKPSSKDNRRDKNATSNLSAMPSLLAVRS